jgi:hypothetical protein
MFNSQGHMGMLLFTGTAIDCGRSIPRSLLTRPYYRCANNIRLDTSRMLHKSQSGAPVSGDDTMYH